jgi:ABC-type transport system substrate-binding protein
MGMRKSQRSGSDLRSTGRAGALRSMAVALAALALVLGAAACGGGSASPSGKAEGGPPAVPSGTLRVALNYQPSGLDPTSAPFYGVLPMVTALYDGLATRRPGSFEQVSPGLATSWKSDATAREWTITLRRGVSFSDGTSFDSAAAKKSIEWYMRPGAIFGGNWTVGSVSRISTPDRFTIVLSYKEPFPDLEGNLPGVKMISPKLLEGPVAKVEKRMATQAAGTGPYILDRYEPSTGLVAHANPRYWGEGPHIAKLDFRRLPDESARNAALQAGDVDLLLNVSPRASQTLGSSGRFKVATSTSWLTMDLNMTTKMRPLDDVRVRQALAYALDPEAIARSVLLGQAEVTGSLMPPGTYGYARPETRYAYDPAKAKALLAEAGVPTPVSLKMTGCSPDHAAIGQALVQQAKAAGFDIDYSATPQGAPADDFSRPDRKYQIYMCPRGWLNGGPVHLGFMAEYAHYDGKRLLDLIRRVYTTPNGPEREQVIADTLEEYAKQLPFIPLFAMKVTDVSVSTLQEHVPNPDGFSVDWPYPYLSH